MIGYGGCRKVTQDDRLLEYSTALKGQLFFIPSKELMGRIAEGELF